MRNILVLLAFFFSFIQSFAEIRTYEHIDKESDSSVYLRDNISSSRHVFATANQVNNNALFVNTENKDLQTTFLLSPLEATHLKFMKLLADLKMIDLDNYAYEVELNKGTDIFSWNVSSKIGLVYLIVKDEE